MGMGRFCPGFPYSVKCRHVLNTLHVCSQHRAGLGSLGQNSSMLSLLITALTLCLKGRSSTATRDYPSFRSAVSGCTVTSPEHIQLHLMSPSSASSSVYRDVFQDIQLNRSQEQLVQGNGTFSFLRPCCLQEFLLFTFNPLSHNVFQISASLLFPHNILQTCMIHFALIHI